MDDTDAHQGGEENAPVADMGGLSALSAAASKRIFEDGDPDLFGSGEFTPPAKSQKNTTSNPNGLPSLDEDDNDAEDLEDDESIDAVDLIRDFDKQIRPATASKKSPGASRRGNGFSKEDIFLVAKAVMKCSADKERGTDKKAAIMWKDVWKAHCTLIRRYNLLYSEKMPSSFQPLQERTIASLKSQWGSKIQPCINKFTAMVISYPPKSGYILNDKEMDMYWTEVRLMYAERMQKSKSTGVPKSMDNYFRTYQWLKKHPRFECHFGDEEEVGGTNRRGSHRWKPAREAGTLRRTQDRVRQQLTRSRRMCLLP